MQVIQTLRVFLLGWLAYFAKATSVRWRRETDEWLRHRLRAARLKQTKRGRTTYAVMRKLGLTHDEAVKVASHHRAWWGKSFWTLNRALPIEHFDQLGLPRIAPARAHSNRPVRTRTPGGVAGAGPDRRHR